MSLTGHRSIAVAKIQHQTKNKWYAFRHTKGILGNIMKNKAGLLLVGLLSIPSTLVAQEWVRDTTITDTNTVVNIKTMDGKVKEVAKNTAGHNVMSAGRMPNILKVGSTEVGNYRWGQVFEASDGNVYMYENVLNSWATLTKSQFAMNFSFEEETPVPLPTGLPATPVKYYSNVNGTYPSL